MKITEVRLNLRLLHHQAYQQLHFPSSHDTISPRISLSQAKNKSAIHLPHQIARAAPGAASASAARER